MAIVKVSSNPDRYLGEPERISREMRRWWIKNPESTRQWVARMPSGAMEWLTAAERDVLLTKFEV